MYVSLSPSFKSFFLIRSFLAKPDCHCGGRCGGRSSRLCCNVCNPDHFLLLYAPGPVKEPRGRNRLPLADFEMGARDYTLRKSLNSWADMKTETEGLGDDFFGGQMILPVQVRDRIVNLAHFSKFELHDMDSDLVILREQTHWYHSAVYGAEVLNIVRENAPPPPAASLLFTRTPLQPISRSGFQGTRASRVLQDIVDGRTRSSKKPTTRRCGSCGEVGHIGKSKIYVNNQSNPPFTATNKDCPNWRPKPARGHQDHNENIPPAQRAT